MIRYMAQIRMSDPEIAGNVAAALKRVRQGIEVIVEHDSPAIAVLKATEPPRRTISESSL